MRIVVLAWYASAACAINQTFGRMVLPSHAMSVGTDREMLARHPGPAPKPTPARTFVSPLQDAIG